MDSINESMVLEIVCHIGLICFTFRLDATLDDGSLGRLCNDEWRTPPANVRVIEDPLDKVPHLCIFAVTDMAVGDEIRYNYGKGLKYVWRVCIMLLD